MKMSRGEILIERVINTAWDRGLAAEAAKKTLVDIPFYQKHLEKAKKELIDYVKGLEERCGESQ